MKAFSKHLFAALLGVAALSSCSRPVAYFQPTAREQFKSAPTEAVAVATPAQSVEVVAVETPAVAPVSVEPTNQAKQAVSQVEAYVRNDSKLASNKKLAKRMDRVKSMLATTSAKTALAPTATASTKKATLVERMALKRIDKQIKNKLSPERTMAKSVLTIGAIIAIIGLILIILNTATALGVIALVVGLVLILLDLLNVV